MSDYLQNIEEGQPLDSIQSVYMTHSTVMKHLIDSNTYDNMMINVCKDILNSQEIIQKVKTIKRKQKFFIGEIIYKWACDNWKYHFYNKMQRKGSYYGVVSDDTWHSFVQNFEEAFSKEVLWECQYKQKASSYTLKIKEQAENEYNILMFEDNNWRMDPDARMIVKYIEDKNVLKICYIEFTGGRWSSQFKPKVLRPELFKGLKKLIKIFEEEKNTTPEILCKKKYNDVYKEAIRRKYLEDEKEEE